jgi:tyrosyl-tRNA synthetase
MDIPEQIELLLRGTDKCHTRDELTKKLKLGRPLRIKFGVDPTSPDIHLGHTVPLLKLRQFQDLGHTAVLIIGDFTATIGDPSGRNASRPFATKEEVLHNAHTYETQAFKILDRAKTEVRFNSEWLEKMTFAEIIRLLARRTVQRTLEREDFRKRLQEGTEIRLHEFAYPLVQGWDSVIVKADVELGGSDQLFNLLVGRDLQEQEKQEPQIVITLPLLEGLDGQKKMSKSLDNYIGVTESATEMFGKTMRVSDELMARWYQVLLNETLDSSLHPMEAKKQLGAKIVARFHGESAGAAARAEFEKVFSAGELPTDLPEKKASENPIWVIKLLQEIGAAPSGSEARRLVKAGAVSLNGEKITDEQAKIDCSTQPVLKCGKKFFAKLSS